MRRRILPAVAVWVIALAVTPAAWAASNQAAHAAPCGACSGVNGHPAPYQGARVRLRRSSTSWASVSGGGLEMSLLGEAQQANGLPVEMHLGYVKDAFGCGGGTAGSVKLEYSVYLNGSQIACGVNQIVSGSEEHDLKIAKCNSTHWCAYADGTQLVDWGDLGITTDLNSTLLFGSATAGASAFAQADWGGTATPWAVEDGSTWVNVRSQDQDWTHEANWSTQTVSPTAPYTVTYNS